MPPWVLWHCLLSPIGYCGIGVYVTLDIMALAIVALDFVTFCTMPHCVLGHCFSCPIGYYSVGYCYIEK